MDALTLGAALLAGIVTFLNPCVLPVLPIVFGSAANEHRWGPAALAGGLALSFTAVGLFLATAGYALGLDEAVFRTVSSLLLVLFGAILVLPQAARVMQAVLAPVGAWAAERTAGQDGVGLAGQFGLGVLLGAVWSPCVGPTLGAATVLASQGERLAGVTLTMLLFGIGAALPLLLIGTLGRRGLGRLRGDLGRAGAAGRMLLGGGMVLAGLLVLAGADKQLEAALIPLMPMWLLELTTSL